MKALKERGIGTMVHYIPIHRQPYYRQAFPHVSCRVQTRINETILSIRSFRPWTDAEVSRVAEAVIETAGVAGQ